MNLPTTSEMLRLTRQELLDLQAEILRELAGVPADTEENVLALAALDEIRALLARMSLGARRKPLGSPAP